MFRMRCLLPGYQRKKSMHVSFPGISEKTPILKFYTCLPPFPQSQCCCLMLIPRPPSPAPKVPLALTTTLKLGGRGVSEHIARNKVSTATPWIVFWSMGVFWNWSSRIHWPAVWVRFWISAERQIHPEAPNAGSLHLCNGGAWRTWQTTISGNDCSTTYQSQLTNTHTETESNEERNLLHCLEMGVFFEIPGTQNSPENN